MSEVELTKEAIEELQREEEAQFKSAVKTKILTIAQKQAQISDLNKQIVALTGELKALTLKKIDVSALI